MIISVDNIGKEQDKFLNTFKKGNEIWLVERSLGDILNIIFSSENLTCQKQIEIDESTKFKVDYFIHDKIVIEFQGYQHFTKTKVAYKDLQRKKEIESSGYKFIEIPYFVQLTKSVAKLLFDYEYDFSKGFPHGFIHPKAVLPCDFCLLGRERYHAFLEYFPSEVKEQCEKSVEKRSEVDSIPYKDFI
jgi:hypothetical protein